MAVSLTTRNTVLDALLPQTQSTRLIAQIAAVVLGTVALTVAAKIQVPVWPVHITLQSMVVAMLAGALGWRLGVATVALYIVQGLSGLPVFSAGGGLGYVFSPSFGFIVGWLPMAYIIGRFAEGGMSGRVVSLALAMILADAVSFAFGFLWLMVVANMLLQAGSALPGWLSGGDLLTVAWNGAVQPFIVWDVLKMAFAALTVTGMWTLLRRRKSA
jgi:biotin transport system substrate-specific component